MVLAASIGALGSLGGSALSALSGQQSAYKAYKYSMKLQQHQYDLNKKAMLEYYGNQRKSLTDAGYNPLLAMQGGSSAQGFSASASQSPSGGFDTPDVVNSALSAQSQKANIENIKANSALATQKAETEKSKRVQMEFQNAMTDVQTHLARKDLDWYDRKNYIQLYNLMQQAENYRATSAIGAMNAETQRQKVANDYALGKYHNESERMNSYSNSRNARTNEYKADTERGRRSFGGFGFSASFTPRNY